MRFILWRKLLSFGGSVLLATGPVYQSHLIIGGYSFEFDQPELMLLLFDDSVRIWSKFRDLLSVVDIIKGFRVEIRSGFGSKTKVTMTHTEYSDLLRAIVTFRLYEHTGTFRKL